MPKFNPIKAVMYSTGSSFDSSSSSSLSSKMNNSEMASVNMMQHLFISTDKTSSQPPQFDDLLKKVNGVSKEKYGNPYTIYVQKNLKEKLKSNPGKL